MTGSWDKTVKYWDLRSPNPAGTLSVHEKVYSMDSKDNTLVIATAERKLHVVDLTNPTKIFKSPECPLRHQIRVVTCFPDGLGFAVGGIEGRVGIIWNSEANSRYIYISVDSIITTSGLLKIPTGRITASSTLALCLQPLCPLG